jgi:hypothetical protein
LITDVSTLATVTFEPDEDASKIPGQVFYKIRSGWVKYRAELNTPFPCRQVATGEFEMVPGATSGPGATEVVLATYPIGDIPSYSGGVGSTFGPVFHVGNCLLGDSEVTFTQNELIPWWNLPGTYTLKNGGTLIEEDITVQVLNGSERYQ